MRLWNKVKTFFNKKPEYNWSVFYDNFKFKVKNLTYIQASCITHEEVKQALVQSVNNAANDEELSSILLVVYNLENQRLSSDARDEEKEENALEQIDWLDNPNNLFTFIFRLDKVTPKIRLEVIDTLSSEGKILMDWCINTTPSINLQHLTIAKVKNSSSIMSNITSNINDIQEEPENIINVANEVNIEAISSSLEEKPNHDIKPEETQEKIQETKSDRISIKSTKSGNTQTYQEPPDMLIIPEPDDISQKPPEKDEQNKKKTDKTKTTSTKKSKEKTPDDDTKKVKKSKKTSKTDEDSNSDDAH